MHGVADGEGLGKAPDVPDGGLVAAHFVAVLDVVVDEGEVVDEFEGEGGGHGTFPGAAEGLAGEEAEGGTDGFAGVPGRVEKTALAIRPAEMVPEGAGKPEAAVGKNFAQGRLDAATIVGERTGGLGAILRGVNALGSGSSLHANPWRAPRIHSKTMYGMLAKGDGGVNKGATSLR